MRPHSCSDRDHPRSSLIIAKLIAVIWCLSKSTAAHVQCFPQREVKPDFSCQPKANVLLKESGHRCLSMNIADLSNYQEHTKSRFLISTCFPYFAKCSNILLSVHLAAQVCPTQNIQLIGRAHRYRRNNIPMQDCFTRSLSRPPKLSRSIELN
jgi:hypothetical protein